MRDEKEERKQGQTNKQGAQGQTNKQGKATQHTQVHVVYTCTCGCTM